MSIDHALEHLTEMVTTKIAARRFETRVAVGSFADAVRVEAVQIADVVMRELDPFGFCKTQLPLAWAGCHAYLQELARYALSAEQKER